MTFVILASLLFRLITVTLRLRCSNSTLEPTQFQASWRVKEDKRAQKVAGAVKADAALAAVYQFGHGLIRLFLPSTVLISPVEWSSLFDALE